MAWSTRELAELAGTTVKAVRYYHLIGLLDEPERRSNGYKQYGVPHLVRLLQVKRLSELGIPLSEVPQGDRGDGVSDDSVRVLDADLEATITRLTRVRKELAALLHHRAPAHVPAGFAAFFHGLSERQRSLLMVYSTVFSEKSLEEFRLLLGEPDETSEGFEALAADADEDATDRLAERMVRVVRRSHRERPWSRDPAADSPRGSAHAERAMAEAVAHLYNPAQLRVLRRVRELLDEER